MNVKLIPTKQITMTFAFYALYICIIWIVRGETFFYYLGDFIIISELFPHVARPELLET
jgi:hypothetical protein